MADYCKLCEWSVASEEEGPCISMELTDDDEECPDFSPLHIGPSDRCAVCGGALESVSIGGHTDFVYRVHNEDGYIGDMAYCASCGTLKVAPC